jgi:SAM-dependent methyltransferase
MKFAEKYKEVDGVYFSEQHTVFDYSDGDEAENYLYDVLKKTQDLSIGSEDLALAVKDWPSLYHLSPKRADLLRPLTNDLKGKRILEIGCGCGAVTRFLGEIGCSVVALEGSARRAKITAERCRDLQNVLVVCDNFQDFVSEEQFDYVTLIGVLEYSNLFIKAANPFLQMLQKVKGFVKSEGELIVAIENKLGLKYWAGAPEDHVGKPYFGIEDKYHKGTAETFGRAELSQLLQGAGYAQVQYYYPFPDYKLPEVVITEAGLAHKDLDIAGLLIEKIDYTQNQQYRNQFSTSLALQGLHDNGLVPDFSNSFLIKAAIQKIATAETLHLAYAYSTGRKKFFSKENVFEATKEGDIQVVRKYLYQDSPVVGVTLSNRIQDETYIKGESLYKELLAIVARSGWTLEEVSQWAQKYYRVLKSQAYSRNGELWLSGQYLDLTPFNILVQEDGNLVVFDQEWTSKEDLPLYYVLFRGLIYSIGRMFCFAPPAEGTPINIITLTTELTNTLIPFGEEQREECFKKERFLFAEVIPGAVNPYGFYNINIRKDLEKENRDLQERCEQVTAQLEALKSEAANKDNTIQELQEALRKATDEQHAMRMQELERSREELDKQANQLTASIAGLESAIKEQQEANQHLAAQQAEAQKESSRLRNQLGEQETKYTEAANEFRRKVEELSQHIDWYKRTYQERSMLGLVKEKIKKSLSK